MNPLDLSFHFQFIISSTTEKNGIKPNEQTILFHINFLNYKIKKSIHDYYELNLYMQCISIIGDKWT